MHINPYKFDALNILENKLILNLILIANKIRIRSININFNINQIHFQYNNKLYKKKKKKISSIMGGPLSARLSDLYYYNSD